jgi:Metallo-beta-lactamase superfamily
MEPPGGSLHIDHTGALGHFPDATVIVQAQELDAARAAEPPHAHGYVRDDFDRAGLDWRPVEGELDLFGDGAIRLLQTPGHSAGHMSLLLQLQETGPVLLTADAADNSPQWGRPLCATATTKSESAPDRASRLRIARRGEATDGGKSWVAVEALWKPRSPGCDPQPPTQRPREARATGRNPQTTRSGPPSRAHGKEGVIGSSPMLGLAL